MSLRTIIFTREEPFFVPDYLGPLLDSPHVRVERIFLDKNPSPFLGPSQIIRICSFWGVVKLGFLKAASSVPGGLRTAGFIGERGICRIARLRGIPVADLDGLSSDKLKAMVEAIKPDVIASIANPRILPMEITEMASVAALNSHGSLLPGYRGILCGFWVLLNRENRGGVTIHKMEAEADSGDIAGQAGFAISSGETVFSYYRKVAEAGGVLWAQVLAKLDGGELKYSPNLTKGAKIHGRPGFKELKLFKEMGLRFI